MDPWPEVNVGRSLGESNVTASGVGKGHGMSTRDVNIEGSERDGFNHAESKGRDQGAGMLAEKTTLTKTMGNNANSGFSSI